jgi:hypothetical protein
MSFFYTSDKKSTVDTKNTPIIKLNYSKGYDLYYSEIVTNMDSLNSQYLSFNYAYPASSSVANFIDTTAQPQNYFTSNLFIFGLLHTNVEGIAYDIAGVNGVVGELIIEHTAPTSSKKVYTCFFINADNKLMSLFVNSNIEFNIPGSFCIVDKCNSASLSSKNISNFEETKIDLKNTHFSSVNDDVYLLIVEKSLHKILNGFFCP